MLKKITLAISLLVATVALSPTEAQVQFHTEGVEELYQMAQKGQKLVFMDLYASWCPPCRLMERDVFSREDVGDFMKKNFVSAKYNVDETIGNKLSNQYEVRSIPTYLIFTPEGKLIARLKGAMSPEEFIKNMSQFIK